MGNYVWVFVQPLYVPATAIVLDLGKRLGRSTRTWTASDSAELASVARDESAFFASASSVESLCTWTELDHRRDDFSREVRAYSLLLCGRVAEAVAQLRSLAASYPEDDRPFVTEARHRNAELAALAESSLDAAVAQLDAWEAKTIAALRVADLP